MTLVVIYGAPGVGKLTTARALAALTGFRVFHNHLSFDLVRAVIEGRGGEVAFVHLVCDARTQEERLGAPDRRGTGKITTVTSLRAMLARSNVSAEVPLRPSVEIDNSMLDADAVARRIAAHFGLPVR